MSAISGSSLVLKVAEATPRPAFVAAADVRGMPEANALCIIGRRSGQLFVLQL